MTQVLPHDFLRVLVEHQVDLDLPVPTDRFGQMHTDPACLGTVAPAHNPGRVGTPAELALDATPLRYAFMAQLSACPRCAPHLTERVSALADVAEVLIVVGKALREVESALAQEQTVGPWAARALVTLRPLLEERLSGDRLARVAAGGGDLPSDLAQDLRRRRDDWRDRYRAARDACLGRFPFGSLWDEAGPTCWVRLGLHLFSSPPWDELMLDLLLRVQPAGYEAEEHGNHNRWAQVPATVATQMPWAATVAPALPSDTEQTAAVAARLTDDGAAPQAALVAARAVLAPVPG